MSLCHTIGFIGRNSWLSAAAHILANMDRGRITQFLMCESLVLPCSCGQCEQDAHKHALQPKCLWQQCPHTPSHGNRPFNSGWHILLITRHQCDISPEGKQRSRKGDNPPEHAARVGVTLERVWRWHMSHTCLSCCRHPFIVLILSKPYSSFRHLHCVSQSTDLLILLFVTSEFFFSPLIIFNFSPPSPSIRTETHMQSAVQQWRVGRRGSKNRTGLLTHDRLMRMR